LHPSSGVPYGTQQVRKNYLGPAGTGGDFTGFEFINDSGDRLLYLEKAAC
jgi:hypothetical protein